jgi:hypothetical protein
MRVHFVGDDHSQLRACSLLSYCAENPHKFTNEDVNSQTKTTLKIRRHLSRDNWKPQQGTGAKLVMTITVNLAPIPSSSFRVRFILLCNRVIEGEKIYHFTKFINKKITTLKIRHLLSRIGASSRQLLSRSSWKERGRS